MLRELQKLWNTELPIRWVNVFLLMNVTWRRTFVDPIITKGSSERKRKEKRRGTGER